MAQENIAWSQKLATGLGWQDEQHQKWIENMALLYQSVMDYNISNTSIDTFQEVIKFLDDYIVYHFSAEEAAMEKANYPHLELHKEHHKKFIAQYEEFKQFTVGEGFVDSAALCYDMNEWVLKHIATVDKDLADFLKGEIDEDLV